RRVPAAFVLPPTIPALSLPRPPHPPTPLFPYTTLFRSTNNSSGHRENHEQCARTPNYLQRTSPRPISTGQLHPSQGFHTRPINRSEEHTSELQSRFDLVCRLLLEKKNVSPAPLAHAAVV